MKINEVKCKSILTKSKLPETDYCINPYIGCVHGCVYCYARFMKRFTDHKEEWGEVLDVKINAPLVLKRQLSSKKVKKGTVLLGSVTDAYQLAEDRYRITRSLLEILLEYNFPVSVLTKSNLVVRDIDLLRQFKDCEVGLTITSLDKKVARDFEPNSSSPQARLVALEMLKKAGIRTYAFIGPILPGITNLPLIFSELQGKIDFVMVESLNLKCGNRDNLLKLIEAKYLKILPLFQGINNKYWDQIEENVKKLSEKSEIPLKGFYRH